MQSLTWTLPADLEAAVKAEIQAWQEAGKVRRLWERDASLWTGTDEASWLGWLGLPEEEQGQLDHLKRAQEDARTGGFDHVLLLGMDGSSLCPRPDVKGWQGQRSKGIFTVDRAARAIS